jgi:EAL domain-containing protein (putative c-di-GMP-specific phosphodiesterase class I)
LDISKKACLYKDITKNVIEKSFKEFENLDYEFSINISYEDINDPTFLIYIEEMLKKYQVSKRLTWEILENENIKNYDVLICFIKAVKKLGCKVSIDDFGTGYSNFEHLLKMDVDCLKIDASLIKNIVKDKTSYKIVETIIKFAKNLNLKTVAEFVENKEIFELVNKLDIDFSQGHYISEPLEKPNFKEDFI